METKLNIAEILKDKPKGTKLYSTVHGKCSFEGITDEIFKINFCTSKFGLTQTGECTLIKFGNMFDNGECIVFPSREMRDWSKFAWKKGDVLVSREGSKMLFDKWASEDYTKFLGKIKVLGNSYCYDTAYYTLASKKEALEFIKSVEEINNGKLNLETLEIEKQPEFRDGDVLFSYSTTSVFIFSRLDKRRGFDYYVALDCQGLTVSTGNVWCYPGAKVRYATVGEKQKLFDALAKEGKAWDAEKKLIVDLKPKVELKPFDKVLVRDNKSDYWRASLFSHIDKNGNHYCIWANWHYCIPYEGNEHLLGTTKNVED